ncbi:hypothetical protein KUTeg_014786 [Tegillarca granosa]|uniref:DIS3-like exonuclease 1 n=1 Tax=Tegillarca granosa TaxID=220873 RepID=A0ABQ9EQY9_TEGGR|nr:hypothetical protein KUTeg_014786 [Tegillarca granosa]
MSSGEEPLEKGNRHVRLKNVNGKHISVVREVYRRDDIPCQSLLCLANCPNDKDDVGLLPADITHYVIPDCQVARDYLEIFETPEITGIIFLQTVAHSILTDCSNKTINVFVLTLKEYLDTFWKLAVLGLMELYDSITASLETKIKSKGYLGYLPTEVLEAGLKSGQFIQGFINVNKSNAAEEAFVKRKRRDPKDNEGSDILIHGKSSRNRAIHGDLVVVELLPRSEWRGRSLVIKEEKQEKEDAEENDDTEEMEESSNVMPTGQVVGIVQRQWREYVATFSQNEDAGSGKVLVIPWDFRIPKIRISTRQVNTLKDQRIVVKIDSWDVDSQYPNGHFVKSLGPIGDLETEISALLVENSILLTSFSEAQELPVDTSEHPWEIEASELTKRRDLRDTHLIFSIDPKGCEDVDDTLSVRYLDNGNIELGVHIADVTHFVKPGSLTDQEAKIRSTTVYLADRRYDMLPSILSANLCSLISGVDRYAVSVIWELDSCYEIAQAMFDGISVTKIVENVPELKEIPQNKLSYKVEELRSFVSLLMEIARHLKAKRIQGGALELESVEVQVQLTETKSIADLTPKDHLEIHDTIAECMIFANHWVAKKIAEVFPNNALLRHHPLPKEEQFANLLSCAAARGFTINITTNKDLADSLDKCVIPGDPEVNKLLRSLATMAMSNASYFSTGNLSRTEFFHYGLALDLYTHFTSPIRRYADVLVHRQLMAAIGYTGSSGLPGNVELDELAEHINYKHRVRISLNDSWAHSASTRIDIVSNQPFISSIQQEDTHKQQKANMIKEVSAAAVERRILTSSYELGVNFEQIKAEYGQTSSNQSFYCLFESFKESAICS